METETTTSKEKYDQVMKGVEAYKNRSQESPELDEEVEEVEKEMQEQAIKGPETEVGKVRQLQENTLKTLSDLNLRKRTPHLNADEFKLLNLAKTRFQKEELDSPVLIHLFQRKEKLRLEFLQKQEEARDLYQDMLKRMGEVSETTLKIQGAMENVDKEIVEALKQTGSESDLPPSAS